MADDMVTRSTTMWQAALVAAAVGASTDLIAGQTQSEAAPAAQSWASGLLTLAPAALESACRGDVAAAKAAIAKLKATPTPRETLAVLEGYDIAKGLLENASSRANLARNVHPSDEVRTAASACEREAEAASTELSLDREVYDALAALDPSMLDPATRYYLQRTLRDFRRAGVDRNPETRARIKALKEELVKLGQRFGDNVKDNVRRLELDPEDLGGLPDDFQRAHPVGPNGKTVITTDNTDYLPFMSYARSTKAREALWRLYRLRGHPNNLDVLSRMLEARQELARLLGFSDWADYITGDKMIGSRKNAADFIEKIAAAARERVATDYKAILDRKRRDNPGSERVDPWESAFLQEAVKNERYTYDSQAVRPYFEYARVKQGVLDITGRMFGVTFRAVPTAAGAPGAADESTPAEPSAARTWHPEVEVYDVVENGTVLGRIYFDMFPRDHKYKHYAQFTLTNGKAGGPLPEGVLVCNFPRPGAEPALMLHDDVETFFHEFGHLLHHIFGGRTRWAGLSGVNTEWDFVEAPSQMLEEWTWEPSVLQTFARHHTTGEPIPPELISRMRAAEELGKGLTIRQQMFYAALSLELHSRDPKGLVDTTRVVAELQERYTPFKFVDGTYFQESFTHLDGYSAIYYTYMWSLVIAKDLFTTFKRDGLMNPAVAGRYRAAILEPGGSKPAAQLVEDFLGRPYAFDAYQEWLNAGQ